MMDEQVMAPAQPGEQMGGSPDEMNPQALRESMNVPPELQEPLDRIILAGKKVMFSEETADLVEEAFAGDGPIEQKLGEAIAGLMGILWQQSNQTMPPMLIIPAAMVLLAEAVDFLTGAGEDVSPAQYGEAIELTIEGVLSMFGADADTIEQELGQGQPPEMGEPMPEQPPAGLIGGAMGG